MDSGEELKKWFVKMGYTGRFPTNLTPIYNASTAPLWQQVMGTVKPREEVTKIVNKVTIDHFKNSPSNEDSLNSELKNVQVWARKEKLQKQLALVQEQINSVEKKITDLEVKNQMKHLSMDNIRKSIEQNRHYVYLLNKKSKQLEKQLFDLDAFIKTANDGNSSDNFDDTFKGCKEKIIAHIKKFDSGENYADDVQCVKIIKANKEVEMMIGSLGNSSEKVWNELKAVNETKQNELANLISQTGKDNVPQDDKSSLAMLYAKHVDYEINNKELQLKLRKVEQELAYVQHDIFVKMSKDIKDAVQLEQREVGLRASATRLQERIISMKTEANVDSSLEIETELEQLNRRKIRTLESLRQKYNLMEFLHDDMKQMCGDNSFEVVTLKRFTADLDWTGPLNCNPTVNEINTFSMYPLEKQNFCNMGDFTSCEHLDGNSLLILSKLLNNTWSIPERLLINFVNAIQKLAVLKSTRAVDNSKRHPSPVVYYEERYVQNAVCKIKSLIFSSDDTEKRLRMVNKAIDLWINMPVKDYVSPKRLLDDHNYPFYQKLYEEFYQNISNGEFK